MESFAAFPGGELDYSFNRMFFNEETEFTQQILHQCSFPGQENDVEGLRFINPSAFFPIPEANIAEINEGLLFSPNALDSNFHYNSQESSPSSNSSDSVFASPPIAYYLGGSENVAVTNDIMTMSLDVSMDIGGVRDKIIGSFSTAFPDIEMEESTHNVVKDWSTDTLGNIAASQPAANVELAEEMLLKRKFDVLELHAEGDKMINGNSSENIKKRPRVSKYAPKVYKTAQSKKIRKNNTSNGNEGSDGQSSSSCSSDDDTVSQDNNGVATSDSKASQARNLNGKTRASRGSATDPQSLYARKRRERINERLRILQNLVPNGTKVDISTMLEEAAHYVKFLQRQIKLLSSDDLWMYAPIAYNGIDIGLNEKISTLL